MWRNLQHSIKIFIFFSFLNNHFFNVNGHIFIYAGCSQEKYTPNSPFETNLKSLSSSITNSASEALYNSFALGNDSSAASPDEAIYGSYQCRGDLKTADCSSCITSAVSQIGLVCPYTNGATLQLDGCFMRYEHFDFRGTLDTSLRYKKCSKSTSSDVEFLRRRDDVMADLQRAMGYKVSSSGFVQGYAQCLGDIGASDCSSCLSDALTKLKFLCGSAEAGDVFLTQCFVRYWASGYYNAPSDSSHEDEVGRTVSIIVGITVGVAVIILFLAFCRKMCVN